MDISILFSGTYRHVISPTFLKTRHFQFIKSNGINTHVCKMTHFSPRIRAFFA
jgi:hypothetical protein